MGKGGVYPLQRAVWLVLERGTSDQGVSPGGDVDLMGKMRDT
jgi:hypothetical protein